MSVNKEYIKDLSKGIQESSVGNKQLLDAGTTGRRYTPNGGVEKHNARIHRESDVVDRKGNMPFSFSKPKKYLVDNRVVECSNCGAIKAVNKNTVGIICRHCGKYASVKEVTNE